MSLRLNKTQYLITAHSAFHRIEILDKLLSIGYKWHGYSSYTTGEMIEDEWNFRMYPHIIITTNSTSLSGMGRGDDSYGHITIDQVLKFKGGMICQK